MTQELVSIKGGKRGLQIILAPQAELTELATALRKKLADSGDFFQGAKARLELGSRECSWRELEGLVQILETAGLIVTLGGENGDAAEMGERGAKTRTQALFPAGSEGSGGRGTLLAKRTLRSGQKVDFDGNVVIWGDVNPGAEIIASGDIIVLGACRGVAHAGASGDNQAVVLALRLQPTQLRIGEHIARPPDNEMTPSGVPEVARIREDQLVIEAYHPGWR